LIAGRAAGSTRRRRRGFPALLVTCVATAACVGEPTASTPSCADAPVLVAGSPTTAAIEAGNERRGGAFIDYYAIYPAGPSTGRIQLTSTAFDPFLILFDETGQALAQAFDPTPDAGVRTAILSWHMDQRCYLIGATSWAPDATGGYLISLQWVDPAS
jgi:hypothetical protein